MHRHEDDREQAAMEKVAASMELKLHGVPRDREARRRIEEVLGSVLPTRVDNGEQGGRYDPLRMGL